MSANLFGLFRERFPGDRDAVFLESPSGESVRYAALDAETARLAGRLRALGATPGQRVVVQVEKSTSAVLLYLACLRAGAIFVPLNTAYTEQEVGYFLEDSEPRLFVCDPARHSGLEPVARAAQVPALETLDAEGGGTLVHELEAAAPIDVASRAADDVAAILYTSGTTGRSKGAMLTHDNLASNALALHALWGFRPGDVLLHALPVFHAHGLFVALHTALLNGSRVVFLPRFDAEEVVQRLPDASVYMGVPTHYTRLLDCGGLSEAQCRGMRLFVSGSAPLLESTHRAFEACTGHRILERYGMTEAGMITSNPYTGERIAGSVGYPLPGVTARVVDAQGACVPDGEVGGLEIRGPNVFPGYWRQRERTREAFRDDGFFITGDLARRDADGRITLVGRARDLVISGGLNVYPKEVEAEIDALPGVEESAVFGIPHPDLGECVTAVVVPAAGASLDEASLVAALVGGLARFKQPRRVFFADALPRNAMGKVQKRALQEQYAETYAEGDG
jgi:malonyl-CoA/methylmalonyl-CoA synthetase